MLNPRCHRLLPLLVILTLIGGMGAGCTRSAKPRNHFWQFWRPKELPSINIIPDDMILPPDIDDPVSFGFDEEIPFDFGNDLMDVTGAGDDPATLPPPIGIRAEEPIRAKPLGELADLEMVHFDFDKANLTDEAKAILERHAEYLVRGVGAEVVVQIQGHCDERGSSEYNLNLGQRRANIVKEYLVGRGVPPSRLQALSYGEEQPLDPAPSLDAYALNRRAQFLALSK
jgi:peptidoglycan-associated lipoprotein